MDDSSKCKDVVEVNDDVPDEPDEAGIDISYCDSGDTVDYDVAVAAAAVPTGATMASYVPKRHKAQHQDDAIMRDDSRKPKIINYYNTTKCGVDVLDKLVRTYSCKCTTRKWTVLFFFNLLDIAACNTLVLCIMAYPGWQCRKSDVILHR